MRTTPRIKENILETGKVPERVLTRAVIGQLRAKRPEVIVGSGIGEDCGILRLGEDEDIVVSTDPITAAKSDVGDLAVIVTVNDLASSGAEAIGILVTALLPPGTMESELRSIMSQIDAACEKAGCTVIGGHTEVTDVVRVPLLSITGIGKVKRGQHVTTAGAKPGMDLVVTKWIGLEGTSIIAKEKREELLTRFPGSLVSDSANFDQFLSVQKEGLIAARSGAAAMHDVTEGGILGALWEMGEASGVGLVVDMESIPIRQETIEVCEFFDINPYLLISSGSMLIATENGTRMVRALKEEGIEATVIGVTTDSADRIVRYDGVDKYLTPPEPDEIHKVLG